MQLSSLEQALQKRGVFFEKITKADLRVPVRGKRFGSEHAIIFSEIDDDVQGTIIFQHALALQVPNIQGLCEAVTRYFGSISFEIDAEYACFSAAFFLAGLKSVQSHLSEMADICDELSILLCLVGKLGYWNKELICFALASPEEMFQA